MLDPTGCRSGIDRAALVSPESRALDSLVDTIGSRVNHEQRHAVDHSFEESRGHRQASSSARWSGIAVEAEGEVGEMLASGN